MATATGDSPSRIAGTMKNTTTTRLAASPSSESAPRARPNAMTSAANAIASQSIGDRRSTSVKLYAGSVPAGGSAPGSVGSGTVLETRMSVPTSSSGARPPVWTGRVIVSPSSGPDSRVASTVAQVPVCGASHGASVTSVTRARSVGAVIPSPSRSGRSDGHSIAAATTVATAIAVSAARRARTSVTGVDYEKPCSAPATPDRQRPNGRSPNGFRQGFGSTGFLARYAGAVAVVMVRLDRSDPGHFNCGFANLLARD